MYFDSFIFRSVASAPGCFGFLVLLVLFVLRVLFLLGLLGAKVL